MINLEEFRKNKKITQLELSKIIKMERPAYAKLIKDKKILQIEKAINLSNYFNISLNEIYKDELTNNFDNVTTTEKERILLKYFQLMDETKQRTFLELAQQITNSPNHFDNKLSNM